MPLYRRLPKRGFTNLFRKHFEIVNLDSLQKAVDDGKLAAKKPVDRAALVAIGLVRDNANGLRLLARGELKASLTIHVEGASKTAVAAVEKAGGKVVMPEAPAQKEPKKAKKAKSVKSAKSAKSVKSAKKAEEAQEDTPNAGAASEDQE